MQWRSPPAYIGLMRAAVVANGDVQVEERPDPRPGEGELLVSVRAAGLNGADMLQRRGLSPAPAGAPLSP